MTDVLYMNRDANFGPWGGGAKAVNALLERCETNNFPYASEKIPPTHVLLMGLDSENGHLSLKNAKGLKMGHDDTKVFLRVNDCDARKGTNTVDERIIDAFSWLDGVIFVSDWIHDYFVQRCSLIQYCSLDKLTNCTVIRNGVDRSIFRPNEHQANPKTRIVSHHWSDNRAKSGDITEAIDEWVGKTNGQFEYTFVGRTKCDLKNTRVVPPLAGKALGDELREHDVYVSETRWDPGPNSILEAIACGLPTYVHRDGGGAIEFAGRDHAYSTIDELLKHLVSRVYIQNDASVLRSWDDFARDVFDFLRT